MMETTVRIEDIARIERGPVAHRLATAMYERILGELEELSPEQWQAETVCAPWTITDIVRHLVGAAKGHASLREQIRQLRHGAKHKGDFAGNDLDAMNALQVADHDTLGPTELISELRAIAPRAVAKRMKLPAPIGRMKLKMAPTGSSAPGMPPSLTLGHLMTVILTRDVFLHRLDIARATGRTIGVDGEHEGQLVADVVAEWVGRHNAPIDLTLTGPAGGHFVHGTGAEPIEMDALDFCWILSGRGDGPRSVFQTRVLF